MKRCAVPQSLILGCAIEGMAISLKGRTDDTYSACAESIEITGSLEFYRSKQKNVSDHMTSILSAHAKYVSTIRPLTIN